MLQLGLTGPQTLDELLQLSAIISDMCHLSYLAICLAVLHVLQLGILERVICRSRFAIDWTQGGLVT